MARYHVNTETTMPGLCRAASPATCKFRDEDGNPSKHYSNPEDAAVAAEKILNERYGAIQAFKKKSFPKTINVETDDRYSGLTGQYPHVAGTRIKIEETGEILTVEIRKMGGRPGDKIIKGYPVAIDENGDEVARYIPGPAYRLVDGPDTPEFKKELERIDLSEETRRKADIYLNNKNKLTNLINNNHSSNKELTVTSTLLVPKGYSEGDENVDIEPSFTVFGSNANGDKSFKYVLKSDGTVGGVGDLNSRLSKSVAETFNNFDKNDRENLFKSRKELEDSSSKLNELESFIRENYNDIF